MDNTEKCSAVDTEYGVEISAEHRMNEMAAQFSSRGLVKSVERDAETQIRRETKTREEEPDAYRLSALSEEYITERYRHGKELMNGGDLLDYFDETRAVRTKDADFASSCQSDELVKSGDAKKACIVSVRSEKKPLMREKISKLPQRIKTLPTETVERVKLSAPLWFDGSKPDTSRETRRFPLSAFASILAIAMSLMLVVASSVLINHAEGRLNSLKIEVAQLEGDVADMKSDLSVQNDLLALREVAVNELGMVEEDFVRMEYVSKDTEDSIVILDEEEEQTVGLSAILNALGIK
ncbi:MAG: hypothetical protein E7643_03485 [Ruminococcaceae bacterium]|nr:hypothetical protein [Oscillospiraceae bacterium]